MGGGDSFEIGGLYPFTDYGVIFDNSKLKITFCKSWTLTKIKISMTCVYKEY